MKKFELAIARACARKNPSLPVDPRALALWLTKPESHISGSLSEDSEAAVWAANVLLSQSTDVAGLAGWAAEAQALLDAAGLTAWRCGTGRQHACDAGGLVRRIAETAAQDILDDRPRVRLPEGIELAAYTAIFNRARQDRWDEVAREYGAFGPEGYEYPLSVGGILAAYRAGHVLGSIGVRETAWAFEYVCDVLHPAGGVTQVTATRGKANPGEVDVSSLSWDVQSVFYDDPAAVPSQNCHEINDRYFTQLRSPEFWVTKYIAWANSPADTGAEMPW